MRPRLPLTAAAWVGWLVMGFALFTSDLYRLATAHGAMPEESPGYDAAWVERFLQLGGDNGNRAWMHFQGYDVVWALCLGAALWRSLRAAMPGTARITTRRLVLAVPAVLVLCEVVEDALLAAMAGGALPVAAAAPVAALATGGKFLFLTVSVLLLAGCGVWRWIRARTP